MMEQTRFFVLRVWHRAEGFRASLRGVGDDDPLWFTEPETLAAYLAREPAPTAGTGPALTERERQIAGLFVAGANHKAIAQQLGLAPATVRNHLSAAYRKLAVGNRSALLRALAAHGAEPSFVGA